MELKITSEFGKFGISLASKQVLSVSGDTYSVGQKLKKLRKAFIFMIEKPLNLISLAPKKYELSLFANFLKDIQI